MSTEKIDWSKYPVDMPEYLKQVVVELINGVQIDIDRLLELNKYLRDNAPNNGLKNQDRKSMRQDNLEGEGFDWLSPRKTCK
ncbi:MAG: hypothetical protein PHH06_01115 [Candidatus Gracilibacteria bacterium]|nr:hypothetical protein [Candidatus Gracilibacteria bacterium]